MPASLSPPPFFSPSLTLNIQQQLQQQPDQQLSLTLTHPDVRSMDGRDGMDTAPSLT
ncbi:MAG: hypothetical protein IPG83_18130 [Novosphingobium sp.]|nr:hypothetical protein [Novosphingobium sp.]